MKKVHLRKLRFGAVFRALGDGRMYRLDRHLCNGVCHVTDVDTEKQEIFAGCAIGFQPASVIDVWFCVGIDVDSGESESRHTLWPIGESRDQLFKRAVSWAQSWKAWFDGSEPHAQMLATAWVRFEDGTVIDTQAIQLVRS